MKLRALLFVFFALYNQSANAQVADRLLGFWETLDGTTRVKVEPCRSNNNLACAIVVKEIQKPKAEENLMGKMILQNLKAANEHDYYGIFTPKPNQTFKAKVQTLNSGRLQVLVCLVPMICQSVIYKKVN